MHVEIISDFILAKEIVNVLFALTNKIPTILLGICGFWFAYMTGEKRQTFMKTHLFHVFCNACVISFCTSLVLHGSTAFYKKLESINETGFTLCSYSAYKQKQGMIMFLLGLMCIVFISFKRAKIWIVALTIVISMSIIILSWSIPHYEF